MTAASLTGSAIQAIRHRRGGDVNADGSIDVLDIVLVVNIIIETYDPSDDEFSAADINNDGVVDVLDIVILVNAILED